MLMGIGYQVLGIGNLCFGYGMKNSIRYRAFLLATDPHGRTQTFSADDLSAEKLPSLRDKVAAKIIPQSEIYNAAYKVNFIFIAGSFL
jgi:hypothetical protein